MIVGRHESSFDKLARGVLAAVFFTLITGGKANGRGLDIGSIG